MIFNSVPKLSPRFFATRENSQAPPSGDQPQPAQTACGFSMRKMDHPFIRLLFEPLEEGGYVATSPDVPGLVAEANTIEEVTSLAYALCHDIAACCRKHGDPLPPALEQL
jgi:predicted RNase H-like HicB family nuclease